MKKYIVITSINPVTKAVQAFSKLSDYKTIIVGDKKTPDNYGGENITYLSVNTQKGLNYNLNKELPFNHYCRKNIGYIYAIQSGADVIIDTDDDNIPYLGWSFPEFNGEYDYINSDIGFVNIYKLFTDQNIWPRGMPLDIIRLQNDPFKFQKTLCEVGIWQGLADADPDVDAIYRLTYNVPCYFNKRDPIVLAQGIITPINSQNTAFRKELFPLLYMPATVTPRFTDILRGFIAQSIAWRYGYLFGVTEATVYQERNPHDLMKDFEAEYVCYLQSKNIVKIVSGVINSRFTITENLFIAYEVLFKKRIVKKKELDLVENWIKDIE
jgi:hypothetical protein